MSNVEFTFEPNYTVVGTLTVEEFHEPDVRPRIDCQHCKGTGLVVTGVNPPDEFNDTPEDVCDACDCIAEVPGTGSGGRLVLAVEEVLCCDEGDFERPLTPEECERFIVRVGRDRLAELANDAMMASEG